MNEIKSSTQNQQFNPNQEQFNQGNSNSFSSPNQEDSPIDEKTFYQKLYNINLSQTQPLNFSQRDQQSGSLSSNSIFQSYINAPKMNMQNESGQSQNQGRT